MTDYMKSMIKRTREAVTKEVTEKVNKNFILNSRIDFLTTPEFNDF